VGQPLLSIERIKSPAMSSSMAAHVKRLCDAAYTTDTSRFFKSLGPGDHLLGRSNGILVSHLMWVTRWLQPDGHGPLKSAYVEMVGTAPQAQRKGYASALLSHFALLVEDFELAALCPATESVYARLGWRFWRGPLGVRKADIVVPTPEERVMILTLPKTPALDIDGLLSVEWRVGEVW
jgi:aminoglycoside 2'-N-acetyltransferase I